MQDGWRDAPLPAVKHAGPCESAQGNSAQVPGAIANGSFGSPSRRQPDAIGGGGVPRVAGRGVVAEAHDVGKAVFGVLAVRPHRERERDVHQHRAGARPDAHRARHRAAGGEVLAGAAVRHIGAVGPDGAHLIAMLRNAGADAAAVATVARPPPRPPSSSSRAPPLERQGFNKPAQGVRPKVVFDDQSAPPQSLPPIPLLKTTRHHRIFIRTQQVGSSIIWGHAMQCSMNHLCDPNRRLRRRRRHRQPCGGGLPARKH